MTKVFDGRMWIVCPFCGKKVMPVSDDARCRGLFWKCSNNKCKRIFEIVI